MKHFRLIQTVACAALVVAAIAPRTVKADEWDKRTVMTFSDTVQVPGATLPAGSYLFKVMESNANRYVVQISNERENHVFATIIAIPDYRLEPRGKTVVTFYEAPVGQPQPVKAWFYPGDNYGRAFVYGKGEASLIAKFKDQTVRSDESAVAVAETTTPAPAPAQNSEINTTETLAQQSAAVATEPQVEAAAPSPIPAPVAAEPEPTPQPQEPPMVKAEETTTDQDSAAPASEAPAMPSTASQLPLVGLLGLVSVAGALSVRAARRSN